MWKICLPWGALVCVVTLYQRKDRSSYIVYIEIRIFYINIETETITNMCCVAGDQVLEIKTPGSLTVSTRASDKLKVALTPKQMLPDRWSRNYVSIFYNVINF